MKVGPFFGLFQVQYKYRGNIALEKRSNTEVTKEKKFRLVCPFVCLLRSVLISKGVDIWGQKLGLI